MHRYIIARAHVFTLSDKNYRTWFILGLVEVVFNRLFALLLMSVIGFLKSMPVTIFTCTDYDYVNKLVGKVRRAYWLSALHVFCGGQALALKCSDNSWKQAVVTLMDQCDVILMDLADFRAGSDYEMRMLQAVEDYGAKVICIAPNELDTTIGKRFRGFSVFFYDKSGVLQDQRMFDELFWRVGFAKQADGAGLAQPDISRIVTN
jgi:hypothetical protein